MKEESFLGLSPEGFHKVYYRSYGHHNTDNTLVCVHGLTRNSADFHFLAQALLHHFHLVCPDIVGRGRSDRFKEARHYSYHQYLADMNVLMQRLQVSKIDWLGTSMGGLIGMVLASLPSTPIRRLILTDVGPFIPIEAIERLQTYASIPMEFQNLSEADAFLKVAYAPFGPMGPDAWKYFFEHTLRPTPEGTYTLDYDSRATAAVEENKSDAIGVMQDNLGNVTFWNFWDKITCPVLLVRGKHSDIVPQHVLDEMHTRGPKFEYVEIEDAGHAPSLTQANQIVPIVNWLAKTQALVDEAPREIKS